MKELLLMRHAKSDWNDGDIQDHQRPLAKRGKRDTPVMAKYLVSKNVIPQIVLCSTAERTRQTVGLLLAEMNFEGKLFFYNELYASSVARYLDLLRRLPDDESSPVMIVGHNPEMEEALEFFAGVRDHVPTASIMWLRFELANWAELPDHPNAKLMAFWKPKEIDIDGK